MLAPPQPASPDTLVSLRDAFQSRLQLGCAIGSRLLHLSAAERQLLLHQFGVLTPENCMKPGPIHPELDRFDFEGADALVQFAAQYGLAVVGHCLVWHQQCPDWLFEAGVPRDVLFERLRAHIHGVAGRYRGRLQGWDVVNEAVADEGEYLRDTPALRALGETYIERAFTFAEEADPGAKLYYNDYNIEQPGKRQRTLRLLEQLLSRGVRVDGVGIQGHWLLDRVPFDDVTAAIEAYRALGLEVMISELDIDVVDRPDCSADISVQRAYAPSEDVYAHGCPSAVSERQAEQYARLFEIFTRPASAVSRVSFWGLHDGATWLNSWPGKRTNHPLLFDRACSAKPAFHAVLAVSRQLANGTSSDP